MKDSDGNYNDDDCQDDDDHDGHNAKSYPESERSGKPPWFSHRGQHQPHTCICRRPTQKTNDVMAFEMTSYHERKEKNEYL